MNNVLIMVSFAVVLPFSSLSKANVCTKCSILENVSIVDVLQTNQTITRFDKQAVYFGESQGYLTSFYNDSNDFIGEILFKNVNNDYKI